MKIVIRMDDISPGMNMGNFRRFKRILDEHHIRPLIGVVPENRDPKLMSDDVEMVYDIHNKEHKTERLDTGESAEKNAAFWKMVRNLQSEGWIIAMHGLHHEYTTKKGGLLPLNKQSEFAGLPLETQTSMLREGKKILADHGIATDFFMAPSHTYDRNTLTALLDNGFRRVTDGFGRNAYRRHDLTFYPISYRRDGVVKDKRDGYTTFVVHTDTLKNDEFAYYEKLICENDVVSWDEWLKEEPVEAGELQGIKEYLMARCKYILVHKKL